MSSFNQITLARFVGKDLKVREFSGGDKVATTLLATNENFTDKKSGERKQKTDWHNIVFSNKYADHALKFIQKGTRLVISGKLKSRSWEENGAKHYISEITVQKFSLNKRFKR